MMANVYLAPNDYQIWDVNPTPRDISGAIAHAVELDDEYFNESGELVRLDRPLAFDHSDVNEDWIHPWLAAYRGRLDCEDSVRLLARLVAQADYLAGHEIRPRSVIVRRTSPRTFHTWLRTVLPNNRPIDLDLGAVLQFPERATVSGGWPYLARQQLHEAARQGLFGPYALAIVRIIDHAKAASQNEESSGSVW